MSKHPNVEQMELFFYDFIYFCIESGEGGAEGLEGEGQREKQILGLVGA